MGLFSKLLGSNADKSPLDILKNAVDDVAKEAVSAAESLKQSIDANMNGNPARPAGQPAASAPAWSAPGASAPASGDSWGDLMPTEENQYNFGGSYLQYFGKVFREDFPAYTVQQEPGRDERSPLFVFYQNGRKALVVELKSERSSAQAIRRRCEAEGVPYLRFYYDHDGWWNTRSYVTRRVTAALNG